MTTQVPETTQVTELPKSPTGISGLDEVTRGGLPRGRPTLICGPAGCGKTLLAMEFLVRGITQFGEPGVFVAFEESVDDLTANVASLGFDLAALEADGQLVIDHVNVDRAELEETGDWDLEGLFLRIGAAIDAVHAKRVVIDTIETLFGGLSNTVVLRNELRRLFAWLKQRGVTAVITGERGEGKLTRYGIEEYVSDCVIVLDNRVTDQSSTRRLRILKYRGSLHGTNEYPFLIGESGVTLPFTSLGLQHPASAERVPSGVARLDSMLGGGGFYRGSAVLVSGTLGTGKSVVAAQFIDATCARGERAVYFAFQESEAEIVRNMRSVGIDLQRWVDDGTLLFRCFRPSLLSLEAHLFAKQRVVNEFDPAVVVIDPVSDLMSTGTQGDVSAMMTRQIDFLKGRGVTTLLTSLNAESGSADVQMASLVDTWLLLKTVEGNGEHNRVLCLLKSRGMANSNQIREYLITPNGIEIADVYVGEEGVLTGSARQAQEAHERSRREACRADLDQRQVDLDHKRESVEAQAALLWREFEAEEEAVERLLSEGSIGLEDRAGQRAKQGRLRRADPDDPEDANATDGPDGR